MDDWLVQFILEVQKKRIREKQFDGNDIRIKDMYTDTKIVRPEEKISIASR